jgi:hypothetical protein
MTLLPAKNHPINCGTATTNFNGRVFAKRSIANNKFDIIATPITRILSYGGFSTVNLDKNGNTIGVPLVVVNRQTGVSYVTDYSISSVAKEDGYFQKIDIISNNSNILSNPDVLSKIATYQSNGFCIFEAVSEDGEVQLIKVESTSINPAVVDVFQSWASGSLAKHCTDQINSMILNKTQLNVFQSPYGPNTFVRNTSCWANSIDISCVSPWNSEGGSLYSGTLISPRHVVFCEHASFYPKNGSTITFVSSSGNKITRTILNSIKCVNADIRVAILNEDVDSGINFAKVLPTNWATYLPTNYWLITNYKSYIPVMCLNQTERASISGLVTLSQNFLNIFDSKYSSYYGEIIVGDSGNPTFIIINGEPILLGVFSSGGAGLGAHIANYTTAINSAMSTLGGVYQLTHVNLSSFTSY